MRKVVFLTFTTFSFSFANWCIYHSLQQKIHNNEDKLFLSSFPNASILKVKGLYRFRSGPYESKEEAKEWLKEARKLNPDAFLKRCKKREIIRKNLVQTEESKEEVVETIPKKVPPLKKLLDNGEKKEVQKVFHGDYTLLDFPTYLDKLFKSDYSLKEANYQEQLARVEALLENSRYDWDLFGNLMGRYSKFINYDLITNKELTTDLGLNLNKRLFDSGSLVKEKLLRLKSYLGKLQSLSSRDKLLLYGISIYTQALFNQKVKELYEEIYLSQKAFYEIIKERNQAGLASKVDLIDAKNDLLELKKTLLIKLYEYLYSDFLVRNSANIKTEKPLKLQEFSLKTSQDGAELVKLFNQVFHDNLLIQEQQTLLSIKKASLKKYEKSYLPVIDFSSSIYYEYKKDFGLDPAKSTHGLNYQTFLNLKFPLYSTENRGYLLEKAKIETLMQKYRLLNTIKQTSTQAYRYATELERLRKHLLIIKEQLALMKEKLNLVKKRYISGLSSYRQYSDAVRTYLTLLEEKRGVETSIIQNGATLEVLKGKRGFLDGKD